MLEKKIQKRDIHVEKKLNKRNFFSINLIFYNLYDE